MPATAPANIKARCKQLYFSYHELPDIIEQTGVKNKCLQVWVYGKTKGDINSWSYERTQEQNRFLRESFEKNSKAAHSVVRLSFEMVQDALLSRASMKNKEGKRIPLNMNEAKDVTRIMTSIAKLMALSREEEEEELPLDPDHQNLQPASIEDLRAAIMLDPFVNNLIPMVRKKPDVVHAITDEELAKDGLKKETEDHG